MCRLVTDFATVADEEQAISELLRKPLCTATIYMTTSMAHLAPSENLVVVGNALSTKAPCAQWMLQAHMALYGTVSLLSVLGLFAKTTLPFHNLAVELIQVLAMLR